MGLSLSLSLSLSRTAFNLKFRIPKEPEIIFLERLLPDITGPEESMLHERLLASVIRRS